MKLVKIVLLLCICTFVSCENKNNKQKLSKLEVDNSQKVVLITVDGLRWQELFSGADSLLIGNDDYVSDSMKLLKKYWNDTILVRRKTLMPFTWNKISKIGQIYGNRKKGNKVDLTNKMHFSYPGYNEILTGRADDVRITSNNKIPNPNTTILELVQKTAEYKNSVSVFGSWDVFPSIINEERSGLYVNAGFRKAKGTDLTEKEKFLNELQDKIPSPWGSVRLDAFTHEFALETMKKKHPKFVYIAYGETDDFAHDGEYDSYLTSATRTDAFIKELWDYTQSDPFYKGNTTFIITTDHGRGTNPLKTWKDHGIEIKGSNEVWLMAFGKGIKAQGEMVSENQLYSNQIASTVLKLLNVNIANDSIGKPLSFVK